MPAVGVYLGHVLPVVMVPLLMLIASAVVFGGSASLAHRSETAANALGAMLSVVILARYALFMLAFGSFAIRDVKNLALELRAHRARPAA